MIPRAYQRAAVRRVMEYAVLCPTGRVLLVIPTRGGKTLVGALLVLQMCVRNGLHALWLVHREELLDEAVAHLIEVGIPAGSIGVIKAGRSSNAAATIQVASEVTLDHRDRPMAHMVVTDESHRDTSPRRRRLRRAYPKAFMLGLTATPKPPPKRDLGEDYDTLMVVVQPSELIHDNFLAVPTVYAPARTNLPDLRGVRLLGGDYRTDDLEPLLLRTALLDEQVREWARLNGGRISLAFPVSVEHSRAVVARFQAAGIDARHLDGDTPTEVRRALIVGLKSGTIPIVSSVGVLAEGSNLPRVKGVLALRPTRSLVIYIQQMMRCATPWEGVKPEIYDVVGNVYTFGFPFADRHWSLVAAESGRISEPGGGVVKRCPACGAMMPAAARACASCTAPFPVPTPSMPDGPLDLLEVEPDAEALGVERKRLMAYAVERGFADPAGWTERVLAAMKTRNGAAA